MNNSAAILDFAREELNDMAVSMSVLIFTQHRENYGAHDWDGEGLCPQYWKFKGGSNYAVSAGEMYPDEADDFIARDLATRVSQFIESRTEMFEEYILEATLVPTSELENAVQEWETITHIEPKGDHAIFSEKGQDWKGEPTGKIKIWKVSDSARIIGGITEEPINPSGG